MQYALSIMHYPSFHQLAIHLHLLWLHLVTVTLQAYHTRTHSCAVYGLTGLVFGISRLSLECLDSKSNSWNTLFFFFFANWIRAIFGDGLKFQSDFYRCISVWMLWPLVSISKFFFLTTWTTTHNNKLERPSRITLLSAERCGGHMLTSSHLPQLPMHLCL